MANRPDLMHKATKAALVGGVAFAASYVIGERGSVNVAGFDVPTCALVGASTAASSITADYAVDVVYPHIPAGAKYSDLGAAALGLGVSGGTTALILNREASGNAMNAFALGAASYAAGDYLYGKVWGSPNFLNY
jgi:hypothetical protein